MKNKIPMIIVHGGAGAWKDERIPIGMEYVEKAARVGFAVLMNGGSAVDAAEACTVFMESCGNLNAGLGARNNLDGVRELDAMIVDGHALEFGSVAAVIGIQNPVSLARYIMEKTEYSFFAGENAKRVYNQMIAEGYRREEEPGVVSSPYEVEGADTVGCIVIDEQGRIATTSSTGGIPKKLPGRVGDSPVMGAGAYANDIGGASATGYGEHIMRVVLSRMAVLYVEDGLDPQAAAEKGMHLFETKTASEAGIIVVDKSGTYGKATNAKAMPVAVIQETMDNVQVFDK
ncbi:MAG: isoaspartyl peptidase/L-asparaginase family protein [Candidatus Thorarchaeota archaeon]